MTTQPDFPRPMSHPIDHMVEAKRRAKDGDETVIYLLGLIDALQAAIAKLTHPSED